MKIQKNKKKKELEGLNLALQKINEAREALDSCSYPIEKDDVYEATSEEMLAIVHDSLDPDYKVDAEGHKSLGSILECLMFCDCLDFIEEWRKSCVEFMNEDSSDDPEFDHKTGELISEVLSKLKNDLQVILHRRDEHYGY